MTNKFQQILIWGLIIIGLGAVVLGMIGIVSKKPDGVLINPVSSDDWAIGNKNAKVVLIEYSDFQCPACAYYYSMVKNLERDFPDDLAVVYRHFPLEQIHKYAKLAAQAAEAAGKQGKFWEMHNVLFEKQSEWSVSDNAIQNFVFYAQALGLDINKFQTDLDSKDVEEKIQKDTINAYGQKLPGTPSFFLNGKQIQNPGTYEEFNNLIQKELK
ncbi:thioredoxin domain-containing protein [Candidatus Wolfebacteria bacterium]|nr:thioredoxin domain-containing protein [Candidatus Wolfebacteria bacterium]